MLVATPAELATIRAYLNKCRNGEAALYFSPSKERCDESKLLARLGVKGEGRMFWFLFINVDVKNEHISGVASHNCAHVTFFN